MNSKTKAGAAATAKQGAADAAKAQADQDAADAAEYEAQMAAMEEADEKPTAAKRMTNTLNRYKAGYATSTTANGTRSQHTDDDLSRALIGMEPAAVAALAERILDLGAGFLINGTTGRYDSLNNGQIRMNSGNRIRAAIKRGDQTVDAVLSAIAAA